MAQIHWVLVLCFSISVFICSWIRIIAYLKTNARAVFLNRQATARYRALASIMPGPGINYTGPREVLLEVVILVF